MFNVATYVPVTYLTNTYPLWAVDLGLLMSYFCMAWVPAYAVYYLIRQPGTLLQVG